MLWKELGVKSKQIETLEDENGWNEDSAIVYRVVLQNMSGK